MTTNPPHGDILYICCKWEVQN